jgi:large subunit ribosomal protein L15
MKLNELRPNAGSRKVAKRVGRGPGGVDKTSGRGHKGQKSRSGAGKGHFFAGSGPGGLISRLPKRGFNHVGTTYWVVNVSDLEERFEAGSIIGVIELIESGLVRNTNRPTKLLGNGEIASAYTVHVDGASATAIAKIAAAGGQVVLPEGSEGDKEA